MTSRFLFLFLLIANSLFSQDFTSCYKVFYEDERLVFEGDTFMILEIAESMAEVFYEEEAQSAYLFKLNKGEADTLIAARNSLTKDYFRENEEKNLANDYLLRTLKPLEFWDQTDSVVYQYMAGTNIQHLGEGVFSINDGHWEYSGGAHGYGHSTTRHFDLKTRSYFQFEDVFKAGTENSIYELACEDLKFNGLYEGMTKAQVDSATEGNRFLSEEEYRFLKGHFSMYMQSYEMLYGVFYAGYPGWTLEIPYKDLKKYIIKDSPVWRLMKASE